MPRRTPPTLAFLVARLAATLLAMGCAGDGPATGNPPAPGSPAPFVVAAAVSIATTEYSVYVSLPPDSIPSGVTATILDTRTRSSVTAAFVAGGFDPVAIPAAVGDTIAITVHTLGAPLAFVFAIPPVKPPVIVRTDPPPHKRDVPLNASLRVVFSEPIDAATLTGSTVQLLAGATVVPGQLAFTDGDHTTAAFVPATQLAASTDYQFVIGTGIRDLQGDPLVVPSSIQFTTASASTSDAPVASVIASPASVSVAVGVAVQFTATVYDAGGHVLTGRSVAWTSSAPSVASVSTTGLVTAVGPGWANIMATSESIAGAGAIFVTAPTDTLPALKFASVSAGGVHTCALTTSGAAYCWGDNSYGALGDGTTRSSTVPAAVSGGLTFVQLSAGNLHTCGVTTSGGAYCWGLQHYGELGDGTGTTTRTSPQLVAGGLSFRSLTAGDWATCGVSTGGSAYCWGFGYYGSLGIDSTTATANCPAGQPASCTTPTRVAGGLTFSSLSAGNDLTCGVAAGSAYCWGDNTFGELGVGTTSGPQGCIGDLLDGPPDPPVVPCAMIPVAIPGSAAIRAVAAMNGSACGIDADGLVSCWGGNGGVLGNGSPAGPETCLVGAVMNPVACSRAPVSVAGGLVFAQLSSGDVHSCALTAAGLAYCWGYNSDGQLGAGSLSPIGWAPVQVAGGISFASISASRYDGNGAARTCGIATGGTLYCWGGNPQGQLGNGTTTNSSVPVKVARQP